MRFEAREHFQKRNRIDIALHFVWTTWQREPFIAADIERSLYRCIGMVCERNRSAILAIGGCEDHVHLLVMIPASLAPSDLIRDVKGVAAKFMADSGRYPHGFRWQRGYGVFSVSRSHKSRVIGYIQNQRTHHANGDIWPAVEEVGDIDDVPIPKPEEPAL